MDLFPLQLSVRQGDGGASEAFGKTKNHRRDAEDAEKTAEEFEPRITRMGTDKTKDSICGDLRLKMKKGVDADYADGRR